MNILVAGLGQSGIGAARLALETGHAVSGCDRAPEGSLPAAVEELKRSGLNVHGAGMSPSLLENRDLLILSPGVPRASELVQSALSRGVPVIGEIEWAARHASGRIAAVTGSNGKSTTTMLLGDLLKTAHADTRVGGNLGVPFSDIVRDDTPETWYVLELSSFQLESLVDFHADAALLLNITPDHQNRYASFQDYAAAKGRIFVNQTPGDFAVFNADDALAGEYALASPAAHVPFSIHSEPEEGAFVKDRRGVLRRRGRETVLFEAGDWRLPGEHNLENALAACVAGVCAGADPESFGPVLREFKGLPHRMERIGEVNGAAVYNDSKATNADAVLKGLTAFQSGVILLLGGRDKGAEWADLSESVRRRCRTVVAFGEARDRVAAALGGVAELISCATLKDATARALDMAGPGDTVLLSPGAASFDEFQNFEDRGDRFRDWVLGRAV
ncbi:MAG: UDP-N-acetylmuramoyl-L-alanine--D-glutamate ligase [Acidobacteriota bacterium]|jgi:UDP-N-acetylmuramoylalanine--D-glutamate ligase